jgi:hypothetical protein
MAVRNTIQPTITNDATKVDSGISRLRIGTSDRQRDGEVLNAHLRQTKKKEKAPGERLELST